MPWPLLLNAQDLVEIDARDGREGRAFAGDLEREEGVVLRQIDVTLQIVRDWVLRFNAHGPSGLIAGKAPGQTPRLTDAHRTALARMIEEGPIPAAHGAVRWRLVDLCQWAFEEYRIVVFDSDDEPGAAGDGLSQALGPPQRMARPVCKWIMRSADQSASTYPASEVFLPAKMEIRALWSS
ncbi:MAG TPA: helix-turn-helix domain-containing protein [Roseiarcus sp.]|jgi:transposase